MKAGECRVLTRRVGRAAPNDLAAYRADGGYSALEKALRMGPEAVIDEVKKSRLTGRGGAGFPTGMKWEFTARQQSTPRVLLCNADEGELGTRKDHLLLDADPFQVLEGITIAAFAIGAEKAGIYINGEYRDTLRLWERVVARAEEAGLLGERIMGSRFDLRLKLYRGQFLYIPGEELALIASIEGRRATSRPKPPFPSESGLFGMPTCVNNVETLANVPHVIAKGADWFLGLGVPGEPGTRIVTLSGDVGKECVCEVEIGACTVQEAIDSFAGGTRGGRPVKAVQPGGGTSAFLSGEALKTPLQSDALAAAGSSLGTAGIMVYEEGRSIVDVLVELFDYYGRQSCGRCAPCRVGIPKMHEILRRIQAGGGDAEDLDRLREISRVCMAVSTCGLGKACPVPVVSALELFPDEIAGYIRAPSV